LLLAALGHPCEMDHEHSAWAVEEFGRAMLTDQRNVERLVSMASQLAARPTSSLPLVFPNPNDLQGACRLLNNDEVAEEDMLSARHEACARRGDGKPLLVCPIDGSSWRFTDKTKTKGTGPVGAHTFKARGLKVMSVYALLRGGVPIGLLAQEVWARAEQACSPCSERELEDKESQWWTTLMRRAVEVVETTCKKPPTLWFQGDCEAEQLSVLLLADELRSRHYVTVRVEHDRLLAACCVPRLQNKKGENRRSKVFDALHDAESVGRSEVRIRRKGRGVRTAHVDISVASVTVCLREANSHTFVRDVVLTVVVIREICDRARGGEEPIEWVLYTTYPVTSPEDALEVVRCYALRWRIERYHYGTKTGALRLPESQLEKPQARRKWIVMSTSVSARLQQVMYRARSEPDVGALEEFEAEEIEAVECLLMGQRMKVPFASVEGAKLGQVVEAIARVGGYQGKRSGGPAGVKVLSRGMAQVQAARATLQGLRAKGSLQGARDVKEG
jgi:hypothetical protein